MKLFKYRDVILKTVLVLIFYIWNVTSGSLGGTSSSYSNNSMQIAPLSYRIDNTMSDLEEFERLVSNIERLMNKYEIKGASVAVTKNEKLVYARGIGYADMESGERVEPRHSFRIASISKLITAVAVMKMHEEGIINIDDNVFGSAGILNDSIYSGYVDQRVEYITVRHLLNHSGGWNQRFGDHMFMPYLIAREMDAEMPVKVPDIIGFALSKRLHFRPGSRTSYSNLGYAILGEVISKASGMEYEDYVKNSVLEPLGISTMQIGNNLKEDKAENEVTYYEQDNAVMVSSIFGDGEKVLKSYGGNDIGALGAAGGWIATPSDLLKLVAAIDGNPGVPDILSQESIDLMVKPQLSGGHTIGWRGADGRGNWWRTGTFAGTSALLMKQNNGISWAVLFNSSTFRGSALSREIQWEVQTALNRVNDWPDYDLFYYFDSMPFIFNDVAMM